MLKHVKGNSKTSTFANSEELDEMPQNVIFSSDSAMFTKNCRLPEDETSFFIFIVFFLVFFGGGDGWEWRGYNL